MTRETRRFSLLHLGGFFCAGVVLGALLACFAEDQSVLGVVVSFLPSAAVSVTLGAIPYLLGGYLSPFKGRGFGQIESRIAFLTGSVYAVGAALIPRLASEVVYWAWVGSPFAVSFVTPLFSARSRARQIDEEAGEDDDPTRKSRVGGANKSAKRIETDTRSSIQQLRWAARILGACVAAHLTAVILVGSQGMSGRVPFEVFLWLLGLADLGCLVAWLLEGLGGAMMIASGVGLMVSFIASEAKPLGGLYAGVPFIASGAVFLICWWRASSEHRFR